MADIEYWRANYSDNIDELEQLVSPLKSGVMAESLRTDERTELIQSAEDKLKRVAQVKKSFSLEMRMLRDRTARADYERTMEALDKRVAELESEVRNAKAEGDRERLLAGGGSDGGARGKGEGKTNDDYLKAAHGIQDKTVASVDHTLQMIEQSRDVGQATLEELQRQREQIDEIDDTVKGIENNLSRADALIRTFGKRMATDKCIQVFTMLNVVMVVIIVVYAIVTRGVLNSSDDESGEATPNAALDDAVPVYDDATANARRFLRHRA